MNIAIVSGRVARDPKVIDTQKSTLAMFSVKTTTSWGGDNPGTRTDYHNISAWGDIAQYVKDNVSNDDPIVVVGEMRSRKYQDKEGKEQWVKEIVVGPKGSIEVLGASSESQPKIQEEINDEQEIPI